MAWWNFFLKSKKEGVRTHILGLFVCLFVCLFLFSCGVFQEEFFLAKIVWGFFSFLFLFFPFFFWFFCFSENMRKRTCRFIKTLEEEIEHNKNSEAKVCFWCSFPFLPFFQNLTPYLFNSFLVLPSQPLSKPFVMRSFPLLSLLFSLYSPLFVPPHPSLLLRKNQDSNVDHFEDIWKKL